MRLLYLPALEYCGLPVGLIVGGKFKSEESHHLVKDWMISMLPFVRILTNDSKNLIAYLRIPADAITPVRSMLTVAFDSETTDWFISSIMSSQTYLMTVFHRLHREDRWLDQWV
jgi:hypothetical protein